jgi:diguanylate cyclase (GGDEF)-like protein/PAS domain S-box-containing protein
VNLYPLRVLVIDDDEEDAMIIADLLREDAQQAFETSWCGDGADAWKLLKAQSHHVYLVDYRLGVESGLDLIRRATEAGLQRPMILLTGQGDADAEQRALESGAADYVVKGRFDVDQLARSIRFALERASYIAKIAASESRYRQLFERSPAPLWVFEPDSLRFVAVNQSAVAQLGYSADEFMNMTLFDIFAPGEAERYRRELPSWPRGYFEAGVWSFSRKDGVLLYADIVRHDIDIEGMAGKMVLARDVTGEMMATRALASKEAQLRQVLADVSDALVVVDRSGIVQFANPATTANLGIDPGELVGQPFDMLGDLDASGVRSLSTQDGQRFIDLRCSETIWEGEPALLLTLRDVSKRHAEQEELRLLTRAVESTATGVVICDARVPDLPIIYVNPAFETLTGYSVQEVLGRNCRFLQGEYHEQAGLAVIREAIREQRDGNAVLRNFRKDGTTFWNHVYIGPVRDRDGELTHFICLQNDLTEQRRYEAQLAHSLSHDTLTGLPKLELFERLFTALAARADSQESRIAIFFIDLDKFKAVNETLGPEGGNRLLQAIAERILEIFKQGGILTRYAGDEFLAAMPIEAGGPEPEAIAGMVRAVVAQPYETAQFSLHPNCSVGIAVSPEHGTDFGQLMRHAEAAMQLAKQEGRNRSRMFDVSMAQDIADRLELGARLRAAVHSGELLLYYQPFFDTQSGQLAGFEALLRWQSSELGLILPGRFIQVAEELGLIVDIGRWVLNEACRQMRAWADEGLPNLPIAVNVSALQIQQTDFAPHVIALLDRYRIPEHMLELELTETALMANPEQVRANINSLSQAGVRFSLDDFGTGYSSLAYLKQLSIHKVKIDRAFVQDLPENVDDAAIAHTIVAVAHQLRMSVTAEGVESEPQRTFLRGLGCEYLQGYLLGRPGTPEQAATLWRASCSSERPA